MDFFQLIASLVSSLAWPGLLAFCLWLFREPLVSLLPRMRLMHKDWELSFKAAEETIARLPPPSVPVTEEMLEKVGRTPERKSGVEELIARSPRDAVLGSYSELETAIRDAARAAEIDAPYSETPPEIARNLAQKNVVDWPTLAAIESIWAIADHAKGDPSLVISKDDARRFRSLVEKTYLRMLEILSGQVDQLRSRRRV